MTGVEAVAHVLFQEPDAVAQGGRRQQSDEIQVHGLVETMDER